MNNEEKILSMLENLTVKVDNIDNRLTNVETEVRKTNMAIENKIEKDIRLLAEGHRGLVDRLWHLPDEVEDIKESVSILKFVQQEMVKKSKG